MTLRSGSTGKKTASTKSDRGVGGAERGHPLSKAKSLVKHGEV